LVRFAPPEGNLHIERIELDIGALSMDGLENELAAAVARSLDKTLLEQIPPGKSSFMDISADIRNTSGQQQAHEAFIHFLKSGNLPWRFNIADHKTFEQAILDSWPSHLNSGLLDALSSAEARTRLVQQFSPVFLEKLLSKLAPQELNAVDGVLQKLEDGDRWSATKFPVSNVAANIQHKTDQQSVHETFIQFLKCGYLPWWFRLPAYKSFEQTILDSWLDERQAASEQKYFSTETLDALSSESARTRLVQQFSSVFLEKLFTKLSPEERDVVDDVLQILERSDSSTAAVILTARQMWKTAFARLVEGKAQTAMAQATLLSRSMQQRNLPHPSIPPLLAISKTDNTISPDMSRPDKANIICASERAVQDAASIAAKSPYHVELKEGIYINCAGIVLLHPFLSRFFETLGISADEQLLQPDRALCLLHFLATGQLIAPEYELMLPKILCNVPLERPVESVTLTATEQEEAAALLQAVINHWEALRNTSADGLRGTFLHRPGKISLRDNDWLLQVESTTCDILLEQLPWGFSIIRLPWMDRKLWVEWV